MAEEKVRGAVRFAQDVMAVLRAALSLRDQKATLSSEVFAAQATGIEQRLDALIDAKRRLTDPDNVRLAKRLRNWRRGRQSSLTTATATEGRLQREHLLRFLYVEGLDATNNRAERMLRPAVITRKTSGCNRTQGGADAHSILASILVTCRQRAISAVDFFVRLQRAVGGATPSVVSAPALDTS